MGAGSVSLCEEKILVSVVATDVAVEIDGVNAAIHFCNSTASSDNKLRRGLAGTVTLLPEVKAAIPSMDGRDIGVTVVQVLVVKTVLGLQTAVIQMSMPVVDVEILFFVAKESIISLHLV